MPAPLTYQAMLMPGVLASPSSASAFLSGISDMRFLCGAMEIFSAAVDVGAPPAFADSFQRTYASFQMAASSGDTEEAFVLAHDDLTLLIEGLSLQYWKNIRSGMRASAMRMGIFSTDRDSKLTGGKKAFAQPLPIDLFPRIVAKGDTPAQRALIREIMLNAFENLLYHSIDHLPERSMKSGILDVSAIEVELSNKLPQAVVLGAKWIPGNSHIPKLLLAGRTKEELMSPALAYEIVSAGNQKQRWTYFSRYSFEYDLAAKLKGKAGTFPAIEMRKSWEHNAVSVQRVLLVLEHAEHLAISFKDMGIDPSAISSLIDDVAKYRFWLSIATPRDNDNLSCTVVPFDQAKVTLKSDRENLKPLLVTIGGDEKELGALSPKDMFAMIARAYLSWINYDMPDAPLKVSLEDTRRKLLRAPKRMTFTLDSKPVNLSRQVPQKWSNELFNIFRTVNSLIKREPTGDKNLDAIVSILIDNSIWPFQHSRKIDHIHVLHNSASEGARISASKHPVDSSIVNVSTDMDTLAARLQPIDFAESVIAAQSSDLDFKTFEHSLVDHLRSARMSPNFVDSMTWLRLLWGYKKGTESVDNAEAGSLELKGSAADTVADDIATAIGELEAEESDLVVDSISERPVWLIERSESSNPLVNRSLTKISVVAVPGARLIHLNGIPKLDSQGWKRAMRAIIAAPEGVTWIDVTGSWKSNRRELILSEGDEGWYLLNRNYAGANTADQSSYRDALELIRRLQRRYFSAIELPLIVPKSTKAELRTLQGKMLNIFHPDVARSIGFIDIGKENQQDLIAAFKLLQEFHR